MLKAAGVCALQDVFKLGLCMTAGVDGSPAVWVDVRGQPVVVIQDTIWPMVRSASQVHRGVGRGGSRTGVELDGQIRKTNV